MQRSTAHLQFPRFFAAPFGSPAAAFSATSRRSFSNIIQSSPMQQQQQHGVRRFVTCRASASSSSSSSSALVVSPAGRRVHGGRSFSWNPFAKKTTEGTEVQPLIYDKTTVHYTGKIFGISTDALFFYAKVGTVLLTVYLVAYTFVAGYGWITSFSLAAVGRMGFMAGFWSCAIMFSTFIQLRKRYQISPNAVYNQAIAIVMKNQQVADFLGTYPKTGDFRAYHASGGFKLPLLRRIRSGSYELADLLGTKPQRLQMMLVLKGRDQREGLVTCDVRKHHTRLFSSSYHFHSLAVHLKDRSTREEKSIVIIGREEDIIYGGLLEAGSGTQR